MTSPRPSRLPALVDLAPTLLGVSLLVVACSLRWQLSGVAALLPDSPEAFVAAFASLTAREEMILVPLGFGTVIAVVATIIQQGTRSLRSRLRLASVGALLLSSVIATTTLQPIEQTIAAGAATMQPGHLAALAAEWSRWNWLNFAILAAGAAVLVAAHRLSVVSTAAAAADAMTGEHRTLLFLLGAATLFEGYDRFIVSLALPYIGKDLGASEGELGFALSLIRIGALLSLIPGRLADRLGRRRVLLFTILAYTVATAATGFSRGLTAFVLFQLVATIFLTAELALAQVVVAEEFPAAARARGQGFLGAFAALGAGVAALLFPLMQNTPLGWRGLYFVGILPLVLVAYLRRRLPETRRWRDLAGTRDVRRQASVFEVLEGDLRRRLLVMNAVTASATFVAGAAFGFASYRATHTFGWTPSEVSAMMLTGGGIGLSGWFVFGRLADAWGRRWTGFVSTLGGAAAIVAFYRTSWLIPSFALVVFMEAGVSIAVNSLGTELFPTRVRATAKAWITNAGIIGAMLGLALVGLTSDRLGGVSVVIQLLCIAPVLCAPLLFLLPETSGAELEQIEPGAPAE